MLQIRSGDWLQYSDSVLIDDCVEGRDTYVAEFGDLGKVIRACKDPAWFDVLWERTGLESTCHVSEFKWLCREKENHPQRAVQ